MFPNCLLRVICANVNLSSNNAFFAKYSLVSFKMYTPVVCVGKCEQVFALQSRVEAGRNNSTIALRVVQGDENGTRCLGVYLGQPVIEEHKHRDVVRQVGGWTQG